MNNRTYIILTAEEADGIVFADVMETSADTLRWSTDNSKTFVKFAGTTPSWLEGKTTYNHTEILAILNDEDGEWWSDPEV